MPVLICFNKLLYLTEKIEGISHFQQNKYMVS